jgi:ADP-ribose pyrophosphatase
MKAKVNSQAVIHEARVFKLVRENVTLPNGITLDMDIIRHPGAAAIVPLKNNTTVILLRQYRHAIAETIWEVPAGTLHGNESPLECAKRELEEETGFRADKWEKLGVIAPLPAYSDERIHVYLTMELTPSRQNLDQDEILEVQEVTLGDALEMISNGQIKDSKTISSLFLASLKINK